MAEQMTATQLIGSSLGYLFPAALRVAVRLGIADQLAGGPRTARQLAELAGADAGHLHRTLRFLATRGVFQEDGSGAFRLTESAALLRSDVPNSLRSTILFLTGEPYWRSAGRLEDTVHRGRTVFDELFGCGFFEYLSADPDLGKLFDDGIASLSTSEEADIAGCYGFPSTGTVVDIAGGHGGFLRAVLDRHPGLRGVLFDREPVLREAKPGGRVRRVAGDFFAGVPDGGDLYLLKRVLHNWDDRHAARILGSCRAAMSGGTPLLVIDAVVPPGNEPHPSKVADLAMMTIFDGKERTAAEFRDLLACAGFTVRQVIPTASTLSIVEALAA